MLQWKRGSKKANSGSTSEAEVVFGMATWKHNVELEVTFFQDKKTKDVDEKNLSLVLKVGPHGKTTTVGSKVLDLADFYRDGNKADKIVALTQGSNPVTLKITIESHWTHIDNKFIIRGKTGRAITESQDEEYDLKTVTFDSEDEMSIGGGNLDFSLDRESDDEGGNNAALNATILEQTREIESLKAELEQSKAANKQLKEDLKMSEGKIETYRNTIKTKNDQINDIKASRDEKVALLAGAEAKITAGEEKIIALQSKLDVTSKLLQERESKNEEDRKKFERELRELRSRNEELHSKLTSETASNAKFLQAMEKQSAEAAEQLLAEKNARKKAEQELQNVARMEESLINELQGVVQEEKKEVKEDDQAKAKDSGDVPTSMKQKDIAGAVVDVIRNRRRGDRRRDSTVKAKESGASKDDKIAELEAKIKSLTADCNRAKAENESLKAQISDLTDRLSSQSSFQQSESSRLANERDSAKRTLQEAEQRIKVLERETTSNKNELQALRKRNEALAQSVRESLEARAVANSALLEMKEVQSKLAVEIGAKQRDLARSQAAQQQKIAELRSQAASQLQEMEMNHVQQVEELRNKLQRLEKTVVEKDEKIANLMARSAEEPNEEEQVQKKTPRGTVADAALAIGKGVGMGEAGAVREKYLREKLEFERIAERAREDLRKAEEEALKYEKRVREMERTLAHAKRIAEESKRRAADAESKYVSLKEVSDENAQVLESAEKEFVELSAKTNKLEARLKEKDLSLEQLQMKCSSLTKDVELARKETESAEKQAAMAEKAMEEMKVSHKQELENTYRRLQEMRNELRDASDKLEAVEADRDYHARRIGVLEAEIKAQDDMEKELSDQLSAVESKLRATTRAHQVAEEASTRERGHVEQLQQELTSMRQVEETLRKEQLSLKEELVKVQGDSKAALEEATTKLEKLTREHKEVTANITQTESAVVTKAKEEVAQAEQKMDEIKKELAQEKQRTSTLELELEGKSTTVTELGNRLTSTEARMKELESHSDEMIKAERQKVEELHAQVSTLSASEAELKKEVNALKQEVQSATEHAQSLDQLLERKNTNIATLEKEVENSEAEMAHLEADLALLKKMTTEQKEEAKTQRERADAATLLSQQLQAKFESVNTERNVETEEKSKQLRTIESELSEVKRSLKEEERKLKDAESERDSLKVRCQELEQSIESQEEKMSEMKHDAEKVPELEEELSAAQESLKASEKRLRQLREASGELGEKVEMLASMEKERRERKLVISSVLLGASDESKELVSQSTKRIIDSLKEWDTLEANQGQGDASCLTKIANAYLLLLQSSTLSYYHCVRVLSQLCALSSALRAEFSLSINDPEQTGVVETKNRNKGQGAIDEFISKIESCTEKAFVGLGNAVFRRVNPYLAPSILNHLPAQDVNNIEETVVDAGNERGKFMTHTVLSTLTDFRDWLARYSIPNAVCKQLFDTLMYNLNAYLFQYLIQTPNICSPGNAFIIKTRLGLIDDWFAQERNKPFSSAYKQLKPIDEAAVLLFVDRESLKEWDNIVSLCPSLNQLQILSLIEMMSTDETQKQELPQSVRDSIDKRVMDVNESTSLFYKPRDVMPLE